MTMERWIEGQQAKGNNAAVKDGKRLLSEYGDIPLILNTVASVEKPVVKTPEAPVVIKRFSADPSAT